MASDLPSVQINAEQSYHIKRPNSPENGAKAVEMTDMKPPTPVQAGSYLFSAKQLGGLTATYESDKEHAGAKLNDPSGDFKGVANVAAGLKSDLHQGISSSTIEERKQRFGENRLPMKEFPGFCELFIEVVFTDPVMLMLLISAIVSIAIGIYADIDNSIRKQPLSGDWAEGIAILVTVLFVGCLQAGIDYMKNKLFQKQQLESADKDVDVIRDGKRTSISVFELVVGDIMLFKYGEQLPVDALYISGDDIAIDEAALTGEPDKLKKSEKSPFLLGGTDVVAGQGRSLVVGVGENSAQGRIAVALQNEVTFVPYEGKASVTAQSTKVLFYPDRVAGKFALFEKKVMAKQKIKLVGTSSKRGKRAGEGDEEGLAADEYQVTEVHDDKMNKTWVITLKIPYDSPTQNVQLLVAEEQEEAGRSVLERKLTRIALRIGYAGMAVAVVAAFVLIIRWVVTDFTCNGGLGGAHDPNKPCGRPFYVKNWYTSGPTKKTYFKMARRYCNNASYPAQSDWVGLCQEKPAVPQSANCDRITFGEDLTTPVEFWGHVKICWTDNNDPDFHKKLSHKWLDKDGNPKLNYEEGYTPNLEWQRWEPYCSSGKKISECKEKDLKAVYPHLTDIQEIVEFIITCITILVVAIPEGLPLAVVLALVYSSSQMSKAHTNCFVKELNSCETMGNATAICSDKTGTLTMNRMVVQRMHMDGETFLKAPAGSELDPGVKELLGQSLLLNSAETTTVERPPEGGNDKYGGNASECGLVAYAMDCGFEQDDYRPSDADLRAQAKYNWPKGVKLFPFHSKLKRMSIIVPRYAPGTDQVVGTRVLTKGASEQVVELCGSHLKADGTKVIWGSSTGSDSEAKVEASSISSPFSKRDQIDKLKKDAILPFASKMLRTFAVCYKDLDIMPDALHSQVSSSGFTGPPSMVEKSLIDKVADSVEDLAAAAEAAIIGGGSEEKKTDDSVDPNAKFFEVVEDDSLFLQDMTLIGILGLEDGVRPEVPNSILKCKTAGITVRMCTGDNIFTAKAISEHCHLIKNCEIENLTYVSQGQEMSTSIIKQVNGHIVGMEGKYFRHLVWDPVRECLKPRDGSETQTVFDTYWPKLRVLARCSPEDKLILVRGLMNSGLWEFKASEFAEDNDISKYPEVVAVTGDGTNDAPALKAADVGFAMGIAGTDIAQNACDIILMDDNFTSIVKAVKWGRNIYDSISKFLQFQLTVNVVAIIVAFVGAIVHGKSPLTAVQLLWVNLIMDSLASLALATEKPTDELLNRKPAGKTQSIMSASMYRFISFSSIYQLIVIFLVYFAGCQDKTTVCTSGLTSFVDTAAGDVRCKGFMACPEGHGIDGANQHYTIIFNVFVFMQIFNEINARQLHDECNIFKNITENKYFLVIFFSTVFTQVFIVEILNFFIWAGNGGGDADASNSFFKTAHLTWDQWLICLAFAAFGNVWGVLTRVIIRPGCFKKLEQAGEYSNETEMMSSLHENPDSSSVISKRIAKSTTMTKGGTKVWMKKVE